MSDATEFNNIFLLSKGKVGKALFHPDRIEWRSSKSSDGITLADRDTVQRATWTEAGAQASLQLYLKSHVAPLSLNYDLSAERAPSKGEKTFHRLSEFAAKDEDSVRRLLQRMGVELEPEVHDLRGLNCGEFSIDQSRQCLILSTDAGMSGEVPLTSVSQVAVPNTDEVEIQYLPQRSEDDTDACELIQVRLHVPHNEDDMPITDMWAANIKGVCDVAEDEMGDSVLCEIPEEVANFMTPKGRYRVEMHKDFFRMRGKTYDFKVMYSSITQMYLLDKPELTQFVDDKAEPDVKHKFFIISLDNAVRQGQQRYPHLVMQIDNEKGDLTMNMTEEQIEALYGSQEGAQGLAPAMHGNMPEMVARVVKSLADKKVFVASSEFKSAFRGKAVRCNFKTFQGSLFPLKKSLCFLHRPVIFLRYDQIESVEFTRQSGDARTWDFTVEMKQPGPEYPNRRVTFLQLAREEYSPIFKFLVSQQVNIVNQKKLELDLQRNKSKAALPGMGSTILDLGDDDDDEDEEEDADSDFDAAKDKKKKKHAADKEGGGDANGGGDADGGSGSGSGSDSDSDSDSSDASNMAEMVSMDSDELQSDAEVVVEGKRKRGGAAAAGGGDKKKKPAAKKQKRDANAPKGAKSAWLYFMDAKREEVKAANPTFALGDISKRLGEMWKAMSSEDKQPFEEQARADRERYKEEMEEYKLTPGYKPPEKKAKAGKPRAAASRPGADPNKPKGAKSAYLFFCDAKGPELKAQGLSAADAKKKLSEVWKEASSDDKAEYVALAAEDKKRFDREMKSYVPRDEAGGASSSPDDSSSDDHSDDDAAGGKKPTTTTTTTTTTVDIVESSDDDA